MTLIKFATETENIDWIGILFLGIGSSFLIMDSDKKISLLLTIVGGFTPLYRFYKLVTVGDFGMATLFPPIPEPLKYFFGSFAIGGYLILLAIIIQLYACLSSPDTVSESTNDNAANDKKTSD